MSGDQTSLKPEALFYLSSTEATKPISNFTADEKPWCDVTACPVLPPAGQRVQLRSSIILCLV